MDQFKEYMRYFMIFLAIILFQIQTSFAQRNFDNSRFKDVDSHVSAVRSQAIFHPQLLVKKLTENLTNDYDKVRAFYVWIATSVDYDLIAFYHDRNDGQSVNDVLRSGKALCSGFSLLFKYFCEQADIQAEVIEGYAKGLGYKKNQQFTISNHAWNAVKIHGYWYLLDVTWATGNPYYLSKHQRGIDLNAYFLAPPEKFIKMHLPEDPAWQLLEDKILLTEFETGERLQDLYKMEIKGYNPNDYAYLNEYDTDILRYKRAVLYNPRNHMLKVRLSFAFLYKGISMTDEIWKTEFNQLIDTVDVLGENFYSFLDSAWITLAHLESWKIPNMKGIIKDELNYQKGVFNYELGAELFVKAMHGGVPLIQIDKIIEGYFEVAEDHFENVSSNSIYFNDAEEYLTNIKDFRFRKTEQLSAD